MTDKLDSRVCIALLLTRVSKLSTSEVEHRFAGHQITVTQWIALVLLERKIANNCAELARQIGHSSGAMTRLVDRLESLELIKRHREDHDRRIVRIDINAAGLELLGKLGPIVSDFWDKRLENFERRDIKMLLSFLSRLIVRLENEDAKID